MSTTTEETADWGALSALPGNPIMWILIISELLVFGAFFLGFGAARAHDPATFRAGQATLSIWMGGLNTLVLIGSGYLAARAVERRSLAGASASRPWLLGAMALGTVFLVIKGLEYWDKAERGFGIETDTFFTLFFLITGFHALHVVMGIAILAIVTWKNTPENLETGATFWHMIDLVWLILFPLVYLLR